MQDQMAQEDTATTAEMFSAPVDTTMVDPMMLDGAQAGSQKRVDNALTEGLAGAFAEEEGSNPILRLSGPGAMSFAAIMGARWQVDTVKEGTTLDRAKVVVAKHAKADEPPPAFYKPGAPNWLGEFGQIGNMATPFAANYWVGFDGVVTCMAAAGDSVVYYLIDYTAPRPYTPKEQQESTFLEEDGSAGLRYGLYKGVEFAYSAMTMLMPSDNLIQGTLGVSLDPFNAPDKLGTELTDLERLMHGATALAELYAINGAFGEGASQLARAAMAINAGSAGAKTALELFQKCGYLNETETALGKAIATLMGGAEIYCKLRGGQLLSPQDFLSSAITLLDAGDEALNAVLGPESGEQWRKKYIKDGSAIYKNTKTILDAIGLMRGK